MLDDFTTLKGDANFAGTKNRKHWLVAWQQTDFTLDGLSDHHPGFSSPYGLVGGY